MQIKNAAVNFSSQHQLERSEQQRIISQQRIASPTREMNQPTPASQVDFSQFRVSTESALARIEALVNESLKVTDVATDLLKALVEAMTGKKINTPSTGEDAGNKPVTANTPTPSSTDNPSSPPTDANATFTTLTKIDSSIEEYEYSSVYIGATLADTSGVEFEIALNITMERSFQQNSTTLLVQQGRLTDPLIINFNGDSAKLSSDRVEFDLNSDGTNELLPTLTSNSAYIALDKNGDGIINNGTELFGAMTGNGFSELSNYDEDGNGFIDENDSVYSQLLAFNMNDHSTQSLAELNVGALFTDSVNSPFRITDTQNNTLGQVRSTGFYIDNDRQAGALQQLDLMV